MDEVAAEDGKKEWLLKQKWHAEFSKRCAVLEKDEKDGDDDKHEGVIKKCAWLNEASKDGKKEWLVKQSWFEGLSRKCAWIADIRKGETRKKPEELVRKPPELEKVEKSETVRVSQQRISATRAGSLFSSVFV